MVEGDTDVVQLALISSMARLGPGLNTYRTVALDGLTEGYNCITSGVTNKRLTVVGAGPRKAPWIVLPEFISARSRLQRNVEFEKDRPSRT
jgi:hypothetical protein